MWTWCKKVWVGGLEGFRIEGVERLFKSDLSGDSFSLSAERSKCDHVRKYCDSHPSALASPT